MAMNAPMGFGSPISSVISPYPGTAAMNAAPGLQFNPSFDGVFDHGLTTNEYDNGLFEDVNNLQGLIYGQQNPPLGYPPVGGNGMPMQGGAMPMQGGSLPMPPNSIPAPTGAGSTNNSLNHQA